MHADPVFRTCGLEHMGCAPRCTNGGASELRARGAVTTLALVVLVAVRGTESVVLEPH
jgi:hypothetical protein